MTTWNSIYVTNGHRLLNFPDLKFNVRKESSKKSSCFQWIIIPFCLKVFSVLLPHIHLQMKAYKNDFNSTPNWKYKKKSYEKNGIQNNEQYKKVNSIKNKLDLLKYGCRETFWKYWGLWKNVVCWKILSYNTFWEYFPQKNRSFSLYMNLKSTNGQL